MNVTDGRYPAVQLEYTDEGTTDLFIRSNQALYSVGNHEVARRAFNAHTSFEDVMDVLGTVVGSPGFVRDSSEMAVVPASDTLENLKHQAKQAVLLGNVTWQETPLPEPGHGEEAAPYHYL